MFWNYLQILCLQNSAIHTDIIKNNRQCKSFDLLKLYFGSGLPWGWRLWDCWYHCRENSVDRVFYLQIIFLDCSVVWTLPLIKALCSYNLSRMEFRGLFFFSKLISCCRGRRFCAFVKDLHLLYCELWLNIEKATS